MSKRRSTRDQRCPNCRVNARWCFCDRINQYENNTSLALVAHYKELKLPSNTGLLTLKCLKNSRLLVRGEQGDSFEFAPATNRQPLYLFPGEDSQVLTKDLVQSFKKPIELVLPDGSWRQAKKFHKREPSLAKLPMARLEGDFEKIYTLRKAPGAGSLCSLEAAAYALGIVEGPEVRDHLLNILKIMNEKIKISRDVSLW